MDTDWESKYPIVSVRALERIEALSDHAPIILTAGLPKPNGKPQFKFELGWLTRDGFVEMVKQIWEQPVGGVLLLFRGGIISCGIYAHTSGVGHAI